MKHIKYLFYAIVCTVFASCMGDSYSDPEGIENPYGNNAIYETNVVTIAELKQMFATEPCYRLPRWRQLSQMHRQRADQMLGNR